MSEQIQIPECCETFRCRRPEQKCCDLACCLGTERGIEICAPVHDAVLICAPLDRLEADVARMQEAMREASRIVLDGFELGTDADVIKYPNRFSDERGAVMWARVMTLITKGGDNENARLEVTRTAA